jgi:5'(3')-deoxyribonucleotidase
MIIACDGDGVVCGLHEPWLRRYNRDYNDSLTIDKWISWDVHKYVKPECGKKIYDYLTAPDLYDDVQPIAGSLEGIRAIRAMGHEVVFVTACTWGMTDQKARWFIRHGFCTDVGVMLPPDFVPIDDKLKIDAHLLIDDRADTIRNWVNKKRQRAILFEYPWNASLLTDMPSTFWSWCQRVTSWRQIVAVIDAQTHLASRSV